MISASSVNGTEIFRITVTSPDPAEAAKIANTITEVLPEKIADIVDGSSVRTVDFAVTPTVKSSPSITKYTAVGMVIGFILSAGFIVLFELLDDKIHDSDYLTSTYDIPVLAEIPDLQSSGRSYGHKGYSDKYYKKYTYGE